MVYDPWEASTLVETLMRAARSVTHEKADCYAIILDELKGRSSSLSSSAHQRLLLGLLGYPTRAKVAKESSALLKAIQSEKPSRFSRSGSHQLSPAQAPTPSCPQSASLLQMQLARAFFKGLLSQTRSGEL